MENVETIWSPFIITNAGLNIRQKAIASNETVTFNYAKIGQGAPNTSENVPLMTDMILFAEQVEVVRTETKGVTHYIGVRIDNRTFERPVLMTEIGVFASIGNSEPVLYGYTYTTQGYDSIPSSDVSHYVWTIGIDTVLSRSQNISFSYDGSNLYVTQEDFNAHIHADMVAATANKDGASGFVPAPLAGDQTKFLRGDGTWQNVPMVRVIASRIRDSNKPDYGLGGGGSWQGVLETDTYTGNAEVSIVSEDGMLFDAKNMSINQKNAPNGTLIITEK